MLKGTIFITDNLDIIYNAPIGSRLIRIVSLDEDGILDNMNGVIGGTCLLPPIEAKIAEADGNEQMYDRCYSGHLLLPYQQEFLSALIAFLYKGGDLILFLPELGCNNTATKLIQHLYAMYGIHPGLIGDKNPQVANCYYDAKCSPIWLNMIFIANVISAREYLFMYPVDAVITNDAVMCKLIDEMKPFGDSIYDRRNYILRFHKLIHKNPKVEQVICGAY